MKEMNTISLSNKLVVNTAMIVELLNEREEILVRILENRKRKLRLYPKGKLHVANRGKYKSYYCRKSPSDITGDYIKRSNMGLAYELAQKEYDTKLVSLIEEELNCIELTKNGYEKYGEISKNMGNGRDGLFDELLISEDEYVNRWLNVQYKGKSFIDNDIEYYSSNGEKVRSKSEILIADALHKYKVPYRYEYPININGHLVYPDFTCLNIRGRREVIWEHFGLMDSPDYVNNMIFKINQYERKGYKIGKNFVCTFENSNNPLSTKSINRVIEEYLI